MPINKKIADLEDGETCLVEKVIRLVSNPPPDKKAFLVMFENDQQTYYTMRAVNLLKPGDRVSVTIKASEYHDRTFYWIENYQKIQKEELFRETKDGFDASDFAHGGKPE